MSWEQDTHVMRTRYYVEGMKYLCCGNEILCQGNTEILFHGNEIICRRNKILCRGHEFRDKKKIHKSPLYCRIFAGFLRYFKLSTP